MSDLIVVGSLTVKDVFESGNMDAILERVAVEARNLVEGLDPMDEDDRKKIVSAAYRVSRSKTFIDEMRKSVVKEWKEKAKKIDIEGKKAMVFFDSLKSEIRQPVTDFENAEKDRKKAHEDHLNMIRELADVDFMAMPSSDIRGRLDAVNAVKRNWEEFEGPAEDTLNAARFKLNESIEKREKFEADQAELERLKKAEAEREKREREKRIASEAAEKARREAEEKAEEARKKIEAEKAEAERRAAKAERDRIDAENKAKLEKEMAVKAAEEKARREAEEKEYRRIAHEKAEKEEKERKARDEEHRRKINNEALDSFISEEFNRDVAMSVISAIARGKIKHITINY